MTTPASTLGIVAVSGLAIAVALLSSRGWIAWLHDMLSSSEGHQLPADKTADVAIVLGYALFRNGTCMEPLKGRVKAGVDQYTKGRAKHIIFSGAHPNNDTLRSQSEANAMMNYAKQLIGSDSSNLLEDGSWVLEENSTSTRENAVYSMRIAKERGWRNVVIVTNSFHQLRSLLVFKQVLREEGLLNNTQVYMARVPFSGHAGWGAPQLDAWMDMWDWLRELAALPYYKARRFL